MMNKCKTKGPLPAFIVLSLLVHLLGGYLAARPGTFDLRAPVAALSSIEVSLETVPAPDTLPDDKGKRQDAASRPGTEQAPPEGNNASNAGAPKPDGGADSVPVEQSVAEQEPVPPVELPVPEPEVAGEEPESSTPADPAVEETAREDEVAVPSAEPEESAGKPVRRGEEFVSVASEKLTFRIVMLGIPVGTATMDASNTKGEFRITARAASNGFISSFYPVEIFADTRLVGGNYLLTRIRRREGNVSSDTGFNLMLREKNAFWVDRLKNRYANIPLPREDVMDVISGFYFLRNQELEVGRPVLLHLFDSSDYSPTTVEVLRREQLRLPGLGDTATLVVRPALKSGGFFRSKGEILIWLTDDEKKVPVRVEAQIPLGKVVAELVSAESKEGDEAGSGETADE